MQTRHSQALGLWTPGTSGGEVQPWEERDSELAAEYRKWKPGLALPHSINKECIKGCRKPQYSLATRELGSATPPRHCVMGALVLPKTELEPCPVGSTRGPVDRVEVLRHQEPRKSKTSDLEMDLKTKILTHIDIKC